jgi:hypothetical protein
MPIGLSEWIEMILRPFREYSLKPANVIDFLGSVASEDPEETPYNQTEELYASRKHVRKYVEDGNKRQA